MRHGYFKMLEGSYTVRNSVSMKDVDCVAYWCNKFGRSSVPGLRLITLIT